MLPTQCLGRPPVILGGASGTSVWEGHRTTGAVHSWCISYIENVECGEADCVREVRSGRRSVGDLVHILHKIQVQAFQGWLPLKKLASTINIMLNLGVQANQQDNLRKIQAPCHCRSCLKNLPFLWRYQLIWPGLRPGYLQICRRSCKMRTTWSVPQHIFSKHCRASMDSSGCR